MDSTAQDIDLERLFKLRLVVGRYGEMDGARWWNTQGMLGPRGATVLKRGFPATHPFVQARVVFEVARSRCQELFDPPGSMTLWHLPAKIEDQFNDQWHEWLDDREAWAPWIKELESLGGTDLLENLGKLELVTADQEQSVRKFRKSAEGRAVAIPGTHEPSDDIITVLAAGFTLGSVESPAIPYARIAE